MQIKVDLAKAQEHGLKPGDVRRQAATLISGVEVGSIFEDQKVFDVMVVGVPDLRHSLTTAEDLLIDKPDRTQVRLGDVAEVKVVTNPNVIRHEAVSRFLDVTADLSGMSRSAVVAGLQRQIKQVAFPSEHHAEIVGASVDQANDWQYLLIVIGAAGIAVFLLLQAAFSSWSRAGIGFLALLASLSGAVIVAVIVGVSATIPLLAGIVAVAALALRWIFLSAEGDRLMSMIVTTLAFALTLLPMVVLGAVPGFEVLRPLAIVTLGGLFTTLLVNLLLTPALLARKGEPSNA